MNLFRKSGSGYFLSNLSAEAPWHVEMTFGPNVSTILSTDFVHKHSTGGIRISSSDERLAETRERD